MTSPGMSKYHFITLNNAVQRNSHSAKTFDFRDQSTLTSTVVDQFVAVTMHLQTEAVTINTA